MRTITFDDKSLRLDGQRIQLVSGAVHYFRIPKAEWRDRLEKCRQGGLNTIETYVAWNFHEYREGEFDFRENANLGAFLDLCHEYGFYTVVRPSPYICGEWDNGGLPAWLSQKPDIAYRCMNASYIEAIARWYDQVVPIIVKRQWTHGGSVILVQIENEYGYLESLQDIKYMEFLRDALTDRGIDVPLITCDSPGIGQMVEGAVKGANFGSDFRQGLQMLRDEQPSAYLFVSELWLAWFDHWGGHHQTRSGREVANALREVLAAGGHYNFYMWCGGTNFGYFAGRTTNGEYGAFNTTSYDYDAPIGETGNLTQKYSECRLVNWMAKSFQDLFAGSSECAPDIDTSNAEVQITKRKSDAGCVTFVQNTSSSPQRARLPVGGTLVGAAKGLSDEFATARATEVETPDGVLVEISSGEIKVLLSEVRLSNDVTLDFTSLECFAAIKSTSKTTLLMYGDPGELFYVAASTKGEQRSWVGNVPDEMEPTGYAIGDVDIVVMNRSTAYVTWIDEGPVASSWWIDPHYGERNETVTFSNMMWEQADALKSLPQTNDWHSFSGSPKSLETFGILHGYGWYDTAFHHAGGLTSLVMTHVRDRALVYLNDKYVGTVGSKSTFARLPIECKPGNNALIILADGLGRYNFTSRLGETKGVCGPVYIGGEVIQVASWEYRANRLQVQLSVPPGHGLLLRLSALREPMRVLVAGKVAYQHRGIHLDDEFAEVDLGHLANHQGVIDIALDYDGNVPAFNDRPTLKAVSYSLTGELNGRWSVTSGIVGEDTQIDMDMGAFSKLSWEPISPRQERTADTLPTLFRASFDIDFSDVGPCTTPIKLMTTGLSKGVIWVNGHNLGRYWDIGPQTTLYVPIGWLCEHNNVVIFDEHGCSPADVRFVHSETFL